MESIPFTESLSLRRLQWKRRGYNRLSSPNRRSLKVARLGAGARSWRFRLGAKLRLVRLVSPLRLLRKLKNTYMKMMLGFSSGAAGSVFGTKRIPKARDVPAITSSRSEFENRLVFEIYKSMVSSFELGYTPKQL